MGSNRGFGVTGMEEAPEGDEGDQATEPTGSTPNRPVRHLSSDRRRSGPGKRVSSRAAIAGFGLATRRSPNPHRVTCHQPRSLT